MIFVPWKGCWYLKSCLVGEGKTGAREGICAKARQSVEHTFKRNDRITERQQCLASYLGTAEGLHAAEGLGTAEGPGV